MLKTLIMKAALIAFVGSVSFAAHAIADTQRFDVPAGDLIAALESFAKQADVDLVYQDEQVKGLRTGGVSGDFSPRDAVMKLLEGTPLQLRTDEASGALLITTPLPSGVRASSTSATDENQPKPAAGADSAAGREKRSFWNRFRLAQAEANPSAQGERSERNNSPPVSAEAEKNRIVLEEIVVTGTHIRGAQPTSPVVTITQEEMRLSGHNNLGEVIRALSQNFNGGQNPGITGAPGFSDQNITGASSLNLRGLGPDATLTLLNGVRLPHDGFAQATDLSVVPVSAIDRMEILLDGASAIYGSDAVGGVANIVLKRDYEGVELSVRYGVATDGGYEQNQYTAVAGHAWSSGGFLVTGDASRNTAVRARDRDYLGHLPNQDRTIYAPLSQKAALFSFHQDLGAFTELTLDAFYTKREQSSFGQSSFDVFTQSTENVIWGVAPALHFALPGEWSLQLHGAIGENEADFHDVFNDPNTGALSFKSDGCYCNEAESAGVEAEGPVFALPGGDARASIGGGYRKNRFEQINFNTGLIRTQGSIRSYYGYAEVNLPFVSADQNIPLVTRFSINGALRYESYDAFGESVSPKLGVLWGLTPDVDIKASWGRSFKAPTLLQLHQARDLRLNFPSGANVSPPSGFPAGGTLILIFGGNPDLEPERAEIITAGFVAKPQFLPRFELEFGWFDIDYTDRVVEPISFFSRPQALINPVFAPFVTLNPTIAQQDAAIGTATLRNRTGAPYDPVTVYAMINAAFTNTTAWHVSGIDMTANYTVDWLGGSLNVNGQASWILEGGQKLTDLASEQPTAGAIFFPPKFKGRIGAAWSRDGFTLSSNINHIGGVKDTNIRPNPEGGSMTTLDLVIDYQMETGPLGAMGFNLAVTNLFNQQPPFLQPLNPFLVNYDSTNYSALGRVVSATLTKRF